MAKAGGYRTRGRRGVLALMAAGFAFCVPGAGVAQDRATLAVAANMLPTARVLVAAFTAETQQEIVVVQGSTGRLYAQIVAGAPFDIFLAADAERPALLEQAGLTLARRSYALGRLIVVAAPGLLDGDLAGALRGQRVALADPALAPYGIAAMQALTALGVTPEVPDLVLGDSVGQVAGFFATGNVDLAFVALSQLPNLQAKRTLDHVAIDDALHDPIVQDGVLLVRGGDSPAARAFWDWLASPTVAGVLRDAGYGVPG